MIDDDDIKRAIQSHDSCSDIHGSKKEECAQKWFVAIEKPFKENPRKFERRTLRDRRNPFRKSNYKGSERRYRIRRSGKDRRGGEWLKDDLGKNIPSIPDVS